MFSFLALALLSLAVRATRLRGGAGSQREGDALGTAGVIGARVSFAARAAKSRTPVAGACQSSATVPFDQQRFRTALSRAGRRGALRQPFAASSRPRKDFLFSASSRSVAAVCLCEPKTRKWCSPIRLVCAATSSRSSVPVFQAPLERTNPSHLVVALGKL